MKFFYVVVRQALYDLEEFYGRISYDWYLPTATDSLNRSYTNAIKVYGIDSGKQYTWFLDGKYQYLEGDIACAASKTPDAVMQIYADDVLVYTSDTIQATQERRHFKVDIGNARFIKMKITANWSYEYYILGNCYLYN